MIMLLVARKWASLHGNAALNDVDWISGCPQLKRGRCFMCLVAVQVGFFQGSST
jgi:hypothetical protein